MNRIVGAIIAICVLAFILVLSTCYFDAVDKKRLENREQFMQKSGY
ncbi:hypothetical protein H6B14_05260 [Phocaeicola coprophilus]|nr:hypothetical protein [Phocaeicola coprophilus]